MVQRPPSPGGKASLAWPSTPPAASTAGSGPPSNRPCVPPLGAGAGGRGCPLRRGGLEPRPAQPSLSPGPPWPAGLAMPDKLLNLLCFHFFLCQVLLLHSEIVLGLESGKETCSGNVNCPSECQTILFLNQLQETTSRGSIGKLIFFFSLWFNQTPPLLDVAEWLSSACGAAAGGPSLEPYPAEE